MINHYPPNYSMVASPIVLEVLETLLLVMKVHLVQLIAL
jgi:hypothetical protein